MDLLLIIVIVNCHIVKVKCLRYRNYVSCAVCGCVGFFYVCCVEYYYLIRFVLLQSEILKTGEQGSGFCNCSLAGFPTTEVNGHADVWIRPGLSRLRCII